MTDQYILDGTTPVLEPDLYAWAQWFETAERHVAETWVTPTVRVSTIFLGLDHQWRNGPPLLWETMIFGGESNGEQWRWSTWKDAADGHRAVVAALQDVVGNTVMTPTEALSHLYTILALLRRMRGAIHDTLNRADLVEAQACLEDVALRLREDIDAAQAGLDEET